MLAFLAIRTNDKVGAILFSSKVERYIPPKKGTAHVWTLIKEIFTYEPDVLGTNIKEGLAYLNRIIKRHAIVFLISDCMDEDFDLPFGIASRKHDLTVIRISDPSEEFLPDVGLVYLRDPETDQVVLLNTRNNALRKKWIAHRQEQRTRLRDLLRKTGVDLVDIRTDRSVAEPLVHLFDQRRRRR
jgi:uncharacterized protein (DUF58 family)